MLVNEFGKFIAQTRCENLPADVAGTVKLRVLDLLAAGLAGYHMGCHKQLLPILGGERVRDLVMGLETLKDLSILTASLKACS